MMTRRAFLNAIGLGGAILAHGGVARAADKKPPNILFILVDDLGPEWLSCYGAEDIKTPNLDRLAETGIRFTNAYSMPQCTPSRATLLTGQYPWRHGWVNHWDVPRWGAGCHFDWRHNPSFAQVLRAGGYATAAAGKWQINDFRVQPDAMDRHGFDEWCMWTGFEAQNPPSAERYWDPYICTKDGSKTNKGRFGADVFAEFLIDFMKRNRDRPQLLYFPMALTHAPFVATPLEPDAKGNLDRHKAMVRYVDHIVGRLVKALDELGLRERTILFFTTDNGTSGAITGTLNGRKVRGGKATLGENGVNAPFIVNGPGQVPSGVVTDALTDFSDMFPTFVELAGASMPADVPVDGASLAKFILGKADHSPREWILAMGAHPALLTDDGVVPMKPYADRVVRDKRFKLWIVDSKPAKLYDLIADPAETHDLMASEDTVIVAARKKLEAIAAGFPAKDAAPRYDPTPPQPWDVKPPGPGVKKPRA